VDPSFSTSVTGSPACDNCYALTLAGRLKAMGQAKYQHDGDLEPPDRGSALPRRVCKCACSSSVLVEKGRQAGRVDGRCHVDPCLATTSGAGGSGGCSPSARCGRCSYRTTDADATDPTGHLRHPSPPAGRGPEPDGAGMPATSWWSVAALGPARAGAGWCRWRSPTRAHRAGAAPL
jgi:hypothetical protein